MATTSPDNTRHHRKIIQNFSLMGTTIALSMLIALALRMIMPRLLGPEAMGSYYFAESFAHLFFNFLPLGLSPYIHRTLAQSPQSTPEFFSTLLSLEAAAAALIFALMLAALGLSQHPLSTSLLAAIMGISVGLAIFQRHVLHAIFLALDEVKLLSRLGIVTKLSFVTTALISLFSFPSAMIVACLSLFTEAISCTYLFWQAARRRFFRQPQLSHIPKILKVSLPFYLAGVLNSIYGEIDTTMLAHLANPHEVAYFGAAFRLIGVFLLFIPIIQTAVTPSLARSFAEDPAVYAKLLGQLLQALLLLSFFLTTGLILFGDYVSDLIYGSAFAPSKRVLNLLSPVLALMYLNTFLSICLNINSSGKRLAGIFAGTIILNIVLDALLIPQGLARAGEGHAAQYVALSSLLCELIGLVGLVAIFPQRILTSRLISSFTFMMLPIVFGLFAYDTISQWSLPMRLAAALTLPLYASVTGLFRLAELRIFLRHVRDRPS